MIFTSEKKLNAIINDRTKELQKKLRDLTTQRERDMIAAQREAAIGVIMRQYAAAEAGRSQSDWMTVSGNPTADIRQGYNMLLRRARDLYQNDPTGRHIPTTYVNNICGPFGFTFQSKVLNDYPDESGNYGSDKTVNRIIESAFYEWGTPQHCTVTGKLSWRAVQELIVLHLVRDGEALCEHRRNDSKYGYQLKVLQPELIDITYNTELPSGNIIVQGIELNSDERVVAYWLTSPSRSSRINGITVGPRERISADRLYHVFHQQHACQVRGVTWMDAIMTRMKVLSDFERYQWVAAKVNSALALIFKDQPGSVSAPLTDVLGKTRTNQVQMDFSELMIQDIGNKDMIVDRAKFPNEMYGEFISAMLSRIGSGVEFDLPLISNDPSQANFSSARFGAANTQENFRRAQELVKDQFHYWVYRHWLESAIMKGALVFPSGKSLQMAKYEKYAAGGTFTGRRWEFIQPLQDVMAKVIASKMRWLSDQQYFAEKGMDMEETYSEIKSASDMRQSLNIPSEFDAEIMSLIEAAIKLDDSDEDAEKFLSEARNILSRKRNGHKETVNERL